ncbi:PQQ-binding-like beta-propeller repeat protein [Actinotalea sp. AC32]|nr:PQQ-binding-like beta-propeller repeat protein [Actinotalea sp. AC32]
MRRARSRSLMDLDEVDVLIDEGEATDEVRDLLHQIALEAQRLRAGSPGDPHLEPDEPPAAPPEPASGFATARRWARRPAGRAVGVVVAVLVALGVGQHVVEARAAAQRAATLAANPAVLRGASGPPVESWRVPGRVAVPLDDALLVVDGTRLVRVDPATGAEVWAASDDVGAVAAGGRCFAVDDVVRGAAGDRGAADRFVACVDGEVMPVAARDGAPARVVVVDAGTGRATLTLAPEGALLSAEPVGRDLLTLAVLPDGRLRADLWDVAAGTARWERVSARPAAGPSDLPVVEHRAGSVTVGTVSIDLATGEQVPLDEALRAPLRTETHTLPGATLTWSWYPGSPAGRGRMWTELTPTHVLPGPPLVPALHDGSEARTVVIRTVRGDRLRALDVRTGRALWSVPWDRAWMLRATAQVGGVLLLDDGTGTTALDVRTGERRWAVRVEAGPVTGPALTGGEVVLLPARDAAGTLGLVARRVDDGAEVWRAVLPDGTAGLGVVGKRLVAWTGDAVVGLETTAREAP